MFRSVLARSGALALGAACALALPASSARANAPAGRYAIAGGTVTDTATKLVWQQAVDPAQYTWAQAQSYCAGLALAGGGWRVPSVKELMTLVDFSVALPAPAIDATAFPGMPSPPFFWSSSPLVAAPSSAWYVYFDYGSTNATVVTTSYHVRCVR
jgi:hypothetical protein